MVLHLLFRDFFFTRHSINADGAPPDASALLDLQSNSKGLLLPRMTQAARDEINSPAPGLMIYQIDNTPGIYMFNGSNWFTLTTTSSVWGLSGNSGLDPATQFFGTTDANPLRFRLNNNWAGEFNSTSKNTVLGDSTGISISSGQGNTSLGAKSLCFNSIGSNNTALGYQSLYKNLESFNVAVGYKSLRNNTTGYANAALGAESLRDNTTGHWNTAVGDGAAIANSTGYGNSAFGYHALLVNNSGSNNTAIGQQSMVFSSSGGENTAVGTGALYFVGAGSYNTAVGSASLQYTTSNYNTAVGYKALFRNSTGVANIAIGYLAMQENLISYSSIGIGSSALFNANADYNVALGAAALYSTTTGSRNTAIGSSMYANTTGSYNTAVGHFAEDENTSGTYNVGIGYQALINNQTGQHNIAVGAYSGTSTSLYNTVSIGNSGYPNQSHNQAFFGNLSHVWNGGNVTWSTYSDARVKTNVQEDVKGLDFINRLRPVTYHRDIHLQAQLTGNERGDDFPHKYDIEQIKFSGFLAQEVEEAAREAGYDFSGISIPKSDYELYTLSYESFVVPLVKAVQEQQTIITEQSQKIVLLENRLAAIEQLLAKQHP